MLQIQFLSVLQVKHIFLLCLINVFKSFKFWLDTVNDETIRGLVHTSHGYTKSEYFCILKVWWKHFIMRCDNSLIVILDRFYKESSVEVLLCNPAKHSQNSRHSIYWHPENFFVHNFNNNCALLILISISFQIKASLNLCLILAALMNCHKSKFWHFSELVYVGF